MGWGTSSAPWNESSTWMSPPWCPAGLEANLERLDKVLGCQRPEPLDGSWQKWQSHMRRSVMLGEASWEKMMEVVVGLDVPSLESSVSLEMRELIGIYLNKYYLGVTIATIVNNTIWGLWLLQNRGMNCCCPCLKKKKRVSQTQTRWPCQ